MGGAGTHAHSDTRTPAPARTLPIGKRRRAGPGRAKTNNLRRATLRPRRRWPQPGARPPGSHLVPPPLCRRRPGPAPRSCCRVILSRSKVEARRSRGPPARRCCSGGRGLEGGCWRHGLGDSAPRALKAEGAGRSPKGGTHTSLHDLRAPGRPPGTWSLQ